MNTLEKIQSVIANLLEIDKALITPDASFESLKIDSLDMVEIVSELEEELDIRFDQDDQPSTISELMRMIDAKQAQ